MPLFSPPNISELKAKRYIKGLNKALRNKDFNIVRESSFALADLGYYAPRGLLVGLLDHNWKIRQTAYLNFAKFANYGFIPLIVALHDDNEMVRMAAVAALLLRGDKRAIPPLIDCLLQDPSKYVRICSADALSKLGGDQVLESFFAARNDPDPEVRDTVNSHLAKLGY